MKVLIDNIYALCDNENKKRLWEELKAIKASSMVCSCCILGDFNCERKTSKKEGKGGIGGGNGDMRMFNALISEMKLEGIPLVGRKFTWYKSNGTMRSRIDRVLATRDWLESWPQCAQWVLDRNVSNHCPIVVKISSIDCGPKPFRFLNC